MFEKPSSYKVRTTDKTDDERMNLPELKRLLMEAGQFKVRGVGRIVGAPNWIDVCFDDYPNDDLLRFVHEVLNAAPELIAACEERDRYKADSEALDWLMEKFGYTINGIMKLAGKSSYSDCPEHLRKRLEGK